MKLSHILGINARNNLFINKYNGVAAKRIARSKLLTARTLKKANIPSPRIYAKFRKPEDILDFSWEKLPASFAVKPSKGYGGEGIIVIKKRSKEVEGAWIDTGKRIVTADDLKLHILDILEGAYSLGSVPDVAFIQEYVGRHKTFRKYAFRGTPDIRVIVFNKVPVMAMLRLPTKESGGRANLHQGAIGVGIDIATGITTKAVLHGNPIRYKLGTKKKLNGIKVPNWSQILEMAVESSIATKLVYLGADIVLHPEKGPMILELNSAPGLQIQLANRGGLLKRLQRVDDLDVKDAEHGVKIAKSLFTEQFADRVKAEMGLKTIKSAEEIKILAKDGSKVPVAAKIDTGAWGTSIDKQFAKELGLFNKSNILYYQTKMSALGKENRPVIPIIFWLAGRKIKTKATVANRSELTYKILVGRVDLTGFLIDPEIDRDKLENIMN